MTGEWDWTRRDFIKSVVLQAGVMSTAAGLPSASSPLPDTCAWSYRIWRCGAFIWW